MPLFRKPRARAAFLLCRPALTRRCGRLAAIAATAALTAAIFILPAKSQSLCQAELKTCADISTSAIQGGKC